MGNGLNLGRVFELIREGDTKLALNTFFEDINIETMSEAQFVDFMKQAGITNADRDMNELWKKYDMWFSCLEANIIERVVPSEHTEFVESTFESFNDYVLKRQHDALVATNNANSSSQESGDFPDTKQAKVEE